MKTHSRNGFTLIEIMIVVAIIGMLAAVAIPGFKRSMDKARQQTCALNRKNIDGAKVQWALEHRKPAAEAPGDSDLFGPDGYIERKPDCPSGGAYDLRPVCEKCACNVPGHVHTE